MTTQHSPHKSNPITVLIVEDDPDIRRAMELILSRRGHTVHTVADGDEAVNGMIAHEPDVIVLDVVLPGRSGLDLCRDLRAAAESATTPVVFVSARASTHDVLAGIAAGGDDYITKPFSNNDFAARVEAQLHVRRPGAATAGLNLADR